MADETNAASAHVAEKVPESNTVTATSKDTTAQTNGHGADGKEEEVKTNGDDVAATAADGTASAGATTEQTNGENGTDGDGAAASKDKKRKSTGGVPEHKSKKLNKKKSMPAMHLECKPGEYYWARLKGYPPWPSVICDEAMLPESLLATRPVSTARPDGSIREDFKEGGKNAKERTFPIMFLHTNEFIWMINTALTPLDAEECKNANTSKMTKALKGAYELAAENHGLQHWKDLLKAWQEEEEAIEKERAEAEAAWNREIEEEAAKTAEAEEAKSKKKSSRKSKGAAEGDGNDAETTKSSKKRKKDAESGDEGSKPKKTPKVTKINAPKTPADEGATATTSKKSASKPKKKVVSPPKEDDEEAKPAMTDEERLEHRKKHVLYLRHRLQKGFLTRDQAPLESEMASMADLFQQLEGFENLESTIIRFTKIHKVLRAIVKIASIPKDEEYNFKKRSTALLEIWNKRMESEEDATGGEVKDTNGEAEKEDDETKAAPAATNGDVEMAEAGEEAKKEEKEEEVKSEEKETVPSADKAGEEAAADKDGDVEMKSSEEATA